MTRRRVLRRLLPVAWLVFMWVMLWGDWTPANLITGIVVALFIVIFLPLPHVDAGARIRPWRLASFTLWFVKEVLLASVQVARFALRPRSVPRSAVVATELHTESELITTMTSHVLCLIPGSLVIEVDPIHHVLYAHVIGIEGAHDAEEFRRGVTETERRVVRTFGREGGDL